MYIPEAFCSRNKGGDGAKTVTKANMGTPIPKICHGLKVAIKTMTYGIFDRLPDAKSGKKSHRD